MTKISDLGSPIPGKRHGAPVADERDHFYNCSYCGQKVDMRDLRQVIWHEEPGHKPLGPRLVSGWSFPTSKA
ncbi:MAG: hypothetical protein E5V59_21970 [Mesorhizobium sp.]|nr:MAG: hypothetical protein E5V59_21970 [Mesorhizobium sp.]